MMYLKKPEGFNAKFEIVSCFCINNGKILLLHRQTDRPQGETWGVPAGKIKKNENVNQAIIRELFEETGVPFSRNMLKYFSKVFVRYPDYDFVYHMFSAPLVNKKRVKIDSNEHKEFLWVTPKDALRLQLIQDLDKCIKLFFKL
ncbi:MAG: NUDIX domain-containing protein [Candidatus Aenigmarchaeota archaeon]|nr:NUDIX domain-containing protein [Candidatus Aenigmarchaeota archaeon]